MSSLVEISQVVLEKKILNFVNALLLFHHYLPLEKNPLHTRMLRAKFNGNWPSDSREKFKNGKSLKSDRWMDRLMSSKYLMYSVQKYWTETENVTITPIKLRLIIRDAFSQFYTEKF